jgi:hypothetical protein
MKIIVENATQKITFKFNVPDSRWYVYVNGDVVQHVSRMGHHTYNYSTPFGSLDKAVEQMQLRGLIPKEFNIEELKRVSIIKLKA